MRSDKGGYLSIRHLFRIEYGRGHLFESDVDSKIQVFDLVSRDKAVDTTSQCWAETMLGVNVNSKVLMKTDDKMVLTPRVFHPSPPSKLIDLPNNQTYTQSVNTIFITAVEKSNSNIQYFSLQASNSIKKVLKPPSSSSSSKKQTLRLIANVDKMRLDTFPTLRNA